MTMNKYVLQALASTNLLLILSTSSAAQQTWDTSVANPGADSFIHAMTVWDDDGQGPNPPSLFVGGQFYSAGGVAANRVAKFDGKNWHALGVGLDNGVVGSYADVKSFAVFDEDGSGPGPSALYVAGTFMKAGSVTANGVAKWDGSTWSAVGNGLMDGQALCTFDPDGGGSAPTALFMSGSFYNGSWTSAVARWTGSTWTNIGTFSGIHLAKTLHVFDVDGSGPQGPALYAGGYFASVSGVTATNIAKWNGSAWSAVGNGLGAPPPTLGGGQVTTLATYDEDAGGAAPPRLFAGGTFFSTTGPVQFARWNGVSWSGLPWLDGSVEAMAVYDPDGGGPGADVLFVAGTFVHAGGLSSHKFTIWNGSAFSSAFFGGSGYDYASAVQPIDIDGPGPTCPFMYAGGKLGANPNGGGHFIRRMTLYNPTSYCTAKPNSLGCLPSIASIGTPKASASSGFVVRATNVLNQKIGMLMYGANGPGSLPLQGGILCIQPPIRRAVPVNSGGSSLPANDCSGIYAIDMNAFAAGTLGGAPAAFLRVAGTVVTCQWWGRDPGFSTPNDATLSNGMQYVVWP